MEFSVIKGQKSFFGVTMTDFDPVDEIGSVMCCQDRNTYISIILTGMDQPIPSGTPFFTAGDPQDGGDEIWLVNLEKKDHRWVTFDRQYVNSNFTLKIDGAVISSQSDKKPLDADMIPAELNFKKLRKNMINFRIIKTELQREDLAKLQIHGPPKYITGKAYEAYLRLLMVRTNEFKSVFNLTFQKAKRPKSNDKPKTLKATKTVKPLGKSIQADKMNETDTLVSSDDDDQVNKSIYDWMLTLILSQSVDPEKENRTHFWTIWLRKKER